MDQPLLTSLLTPAGPPALGPEQRQTRMPAPDLLRQLDELFRAAKTPPANSDALRALVLLWHDDLDASHNLAQKIESPDGSFLHGMMHRRERDFGNAKYWFTRAKAHPALPLISTEAEKVFRGGGASNIRPRLLRDGQWDPFVFVDLCQELSGISPTDPRVELLQQLQASEFHGLLHHLAGDSP